MIRSRESQPPATLERTPSQGWHTHAAASALGVATIATVIAVVWAGIPNELHVPLVLVVCASYLAMLGAQRRWGGLTMRTVAVALGTQLAAAIAAPPRSSRDLWWYAIYGRVAGVHHANPYVTAPAKFPGDAIFRHVSGGWEHTKSVYGPLFTGISATASKFLGTSLLANRLFYQGLALTAVVAACVIVWRHTRSVAAVAFLGANPVVVLYLVNGGKNDALVGLALLGAVVLSMRGHDRAAGFVGGLGALVKVTGLVGLAALIVVIVSMRGWRAARQCALTSAGLMAFGYALAGSAALFTPMKTAGSMFTRASVWKAFQSIGIEQPISAVALVVMAVLVVVALKRGARRLADAAVTESMMTMTLAAPYALGAYVGWSLPSAALDHESRTSRITMAFSVMMVAAYEVFRHPTSHALLGVAAVTAPLGSLVLLVLLLRRREIGRQPVGRAMIDHGASAGSPEVSADTLVVIPTLDERANLEPVLRGVRAMAPSAHVLVVDDGSTDGTPEAATAVAAELGQIEVLRRVGEVGFASAHRAGFRIALCDGYRVVVTMDADRSHDPTSLPQLLAAIGEGADLAIGSRYVAGGTTPGWPLHRRLLSRAGGAYASRMLKMAVHDPTSGYRAYRAGVLRIVDLDSLEADGYGFQIEMAHRVTATGAAIVEVPIEFRDRTAGHSKMSMSIITEALVLVTRWALVERWRLLFDRRFRVREASLHARAVPSVARRG